MMADDLLGQGIAALKAGKKAEARRLLMQAIRQDKHNERAWLWLSGTVDTDKERRICLENILAINPGNEIARRGLASLVTEESVRPLDAVSLPEPAAQPAVTLCPQAMQPTVRANAPGMIQQKGRKITPKRPPKKRIGLLVGVAAGILIIVGLWWAINNNLLPSAIDPNSPERVARYFLTQEWTSDDITPDAIYDGDLELYRYLSQRPRYEYEIEIHDVLVRDTADSNVKKVTVLFTNYFNGYEVSGAAFTDPNWDIESEPLTGERWHNDRSALLIIEFLDGRWRIRCAEATTSGEAPSLCIRNEIW